MRRVALTDLAVVVATLVLLPVSLFVVYRVPHSCVSSSVLASRAFAVWALTVGVLALIVYVGGLRISPRRVAVRVLVLEAFILPATIAASSLDFGMQDRWREKRAMADM